jgi:hypothetical protein
MKKKTYDKDIEKRLAEIKIELDDLKHGRKNAPIKYKSYTQKEANLMARLDLFDEQEALWKEIGVR